MCFHDAFELSWVCVRDGIPATGNPSVVNEDIYVAKVRGDVCHHLTHSFIVIYGCLIGLGSHAQCADHSQCFGSALFISPIINGDIRAIFGQTQRNTSTDTPVASGDTVSIIPSVAGGERS